MIRAAVRGLCLGVALLPCAAQVGAAAGDERPAADAREAQAPTRVDPMDALAFGSPAADRVLRERTDAAARHMFHVSLAYLFSLFLAMNVEILLFR